MYENELSPLEAIIDGLQAKQHLEMMRLLARHPQEGTAWEDACKQCGVRQGTVGGGLMLASLKNTLRSPKTCLRSLCVKELSITTCAVSRKQQPKRQSQHMQHTHAHHAHGIFAALASIACGWRGILWNSLLRVLSEASLLAHWQVAQRISSFEP